MTVHQAILRLGASRPHGPARMQMEVIIMSKIQIASLVLALMLPACTQWDKLIGNEDDNDSAAAAPAPAPAPPAQPPLVASGVDVYNDALVPAGVPTDPEMELEATAPIVLFNQS